MKIAVGSMWRDSSRYLDRSFDQFTRLAKELDARGDDVSFLWVESSSSDDTYDRLASSDLPHVLLKMDDDCPFFESKDDRARWRHLAWLSNGVLDLITDETRIIYVESDLAWEPETMLALLEHLDRVDVVSPLNMRSNGQYYDIWGSRGLDGRRFTMNEPFHPSLVDASGLVQVQSIAGCTAFHREVAASCRFSADDCYVGWNRDMRLNSYTVWCDPDLRVWHD